MSRAKRIGETAPAPLRHHQVGEKKIDPSSAIFAEQAPRVTAVGRFDHFVAQTAEHAHGNVANTNVVFENKDGFGAAARFLASWSSYMMVAAARAHAGDKFAPSCRFPVRFRRANVRCFGGQCRNKLQGRAHFAPDRLWW